MRHHSLKEHTISFGHALEGIVYVFRTQPNLRVHCLVACIVYSLAYVLHLSLFEWIALVLTVGFVVTAEMVNTSIEAMTDLITTEYQQDAKIAKDVAAGMVLVAACTAVIVGFIIFMPHLVAGAQ